MVQLGFDVVAFGDKLLGGPCRLLVAQRRHSKTSKTPARASMRQNAIGGGHCDMNSISVAKRTIYPLATEYEPNNREAARPLRCVAERLGSR